MQQTFRVKPFDRYLTLTMLAIVLPLLIAVPWMISEDVKPENVWVGLLVFGTLFGLLTLSATHAVLHNWRTVLIIKEDQISLQGILRLRIFKLSEINKVDWGIGTVLRLETPSNRCSILLNDFTAEEKAIIVSYFHYRLSESIQENWGNYCARASALKKNKDLFAREQQVSLGMTQK